MKNSIPSEVVLWGFRHFVLYLCCFLPTKYLFCIFLCIDLPLNVRVLIGRDHWKQAQAESPVVLLATSLFWLPRYLYCLFINWSISFQTYNKGWMGQNQLEAGSSSLLSCHLCHIRNSP